MLVQFQVWLCCAPMVTVTFRCPQRQSEGGWCLSDHLSRMRHGLQAVPSKTDLPCRPWEFSSPEGSHALKGHASEVVSYVPPSPKNTENVRSKCSSKSLNRPVERCELDAVMPKLYTAARISTPQSFHGRSWFYANLLFLTVVQFIITVGYPLWTCLYCKLYSPGCSAILLASRKRQPIRKRSQNAVQRCWNSLRGLRMSSYSSRTCRRSPPSILRDLSDQIRRIRWLVYIDSFCAYPPIPWCVVDVWLTPLP